MFNYTSSISELAHSIIKRYLKNDLAIDCTLGNGYDTLFLSEIFSKVHSFEIDVKSIENFRKRNLKNVDLYNISHEEIGKYFPNNSVDTIIYNLGFLPGGDKNITTMTHSTIKSVESAILIIKPSGMILIGTYLGHEEGVREKEALDKYLTKLPKNEFGVMVHMCINRSDLSPILYVIEKKGVSLNG